MEELIDKICASDLEPDEDVERRLAERLTDNVVERVSSSYNDAFQAGERLDKTLEKVQRRPPGIRHQHHFRLEDSR